MTPDRDDGERGSAIVEFVFIALVVFLPLVYLVAGFSAVQRGVFAADEAAREAGRALGTAPDLATGQARAEAAVQVAVADQSVEATDVRIGYAAPGGGCDAAGSYQPTLTPGETFSVCVTVTVRIPLLPDFIDANTATGQFVVDRDRYVDG
ncbi:TadE family protein [Modestobacter sp. NPDC049651]|uniref:TadE family protein n=1 Tax=unclassified Modestobacter TaxID=2643866 RepID=UPI00340732DB